MKQSIKYKNAKEFAKDLGLSEIGIALVQQKKKLIEKLKAKRAEKKISQAALAKLIGSKQPAIARMESGQISEISMDFLVKVAVALNMSFTIKPPQAA